MKVFKFGGASINSIDRIKNTATLSMMPTKAEKIIGGVFLPWAKQPMPWKK